MFIVVFLFRHMHHHHHHHHGSTNTKYLAWLSLCTCVSSVFSNENSQLTNLFCVRVVLHYCRSYVKTYEVQTFWSFSELELWENHFLSLLSFFFFPICQYHNLITLGQDENTKQIPNRSYSFDENTFSLQCCRLYNTISISHIAICHTDEIPDKILGTFQQWITNNTNN